MNDTATVIPSLPLSTTRKAAGLLFLSGRLALENGAIVDSTIAEQTITILREIDAILASEGLGRADVVKVTTWLSNAADFADYNRTYAEWFAAPYPVRSTVVSALLVPGALIEIECIADMRA